MRKEHGPWYECSGHEDDYNSCMFCDGGLSYCESCGAFEGATPDECPDKRMTGRESDDVYAGKLNYRDGRWRRNECCQVMRPTYDRVNWMKEQGYELDGINNAENQKWRKIND